MRGIALAALLLTAIGSVKATQISGSWSYTSSGNPKDFFAMEVFQNGAFVCGQVTATSGGTNHVDASWIVGKVAGDSIEVEFESGFNERGKRGLARLDLKNARLKWQVTRDIAPSHIWDTATLIRVPWEKRHKKIVANWCKRNWQKIEQGGSNDINLQP